MDSDFGKTLEGFTYLRMKALISLFLNFNMLFKINELICIIV